MRSGEHPASPLHRRFRATSRGGRAGTSGTSSPSPRRMPRAPHLRAGWGRRSWALGCACAEGDGGSWRADGLGAGCWGELLRGAGVWSLDWGEEGREMSGSCCVPVWNRCRTACGGEGPDPRLPAEIPAAPGAQGRLQPHRRMAGGPPSSAFVERDRHAEAGGLVFPLQGLLSPVLSAFTLKTCQA